MSPNENTKKPGNLKIVFFGTPDFAIETLKRILESGFEVKAVVTAPDKPAGRGKKMKSSEVKKFALEKGLPLLQPKNLKDPVFIQKLEDLNPDVGVVVAFRMLPESVWKIPRLGTFNVHASLLPDYRGAAPIHHAIINGETQTGVTTFFINEQIDTGEIINQIPVEIRPDDTFGTLYEKLKQAGAGLAVKTLQKILSGTIQTQKQDPALAIHSAPKLNKENTRIYWNLPVKKIYDFIRGLSPFPGAWTFYYSDSKNPKRMIIYKADFMKENHHLEPGTALIKDKKLMIAAADGFLLPLELKPESKKKMNVKDFINGWNKKKILLFK